MKKPFIHALGAVLYIVFIFSVLQTSTWILKEQEGTFIIPITMLSLFVLSAAVMGYLFLSESIVLLVEGKKKEATLFFGKVVGIFACFVLILGIIVFLV